MVVVNRKMTVKEPPEEVCFHLCCSGVCSCWSVLCLVGLLSGTKYGTRNESLIRLKSSIELSHSDSTVTFPPSLDSLSLIWKYN